MVVIGWRGDSGVIVTQSGFFLVFNSSHHGKIALIKVNLYVRWFLQDSLFAQSVAFYSFNLALDPTRMCESQAYDAWCLDPEINRSRRL